VVVEMLDAHGEYEVNGSISWFLMSCFWGTVSSIPPTGSVIATWVTFPIVVILTTVPVILGPALGLGTLGLAVPPIKQTSLSITCSITNSVLEYFSTRLPVGSSIAALPRVDPKVTISLIKLTGKLVTLWITLPVTSLGIAVVESAVCLLLLVVKEHQVFARVGGGGGDINTSW